jgi:predicted DNA-binding WGR domain protein
MARFYSLMIERDLFGTITLARNWGQIGTNGRELVQEFPARPVRRWRCWFKLSCGGAIGLGGD